MTEAMDSEMMYSAETEIKSGLKLLRPPDGLTTDEVLAWSHAHGVFYAAVRKFDRGRSFAVIQYYRPEVNVNPREHKDTHVVVKEIIQFGPTSIVAVDLATAQALADVLNEKLSAVARQQWSEAMENVHKRIIDQLRGILVAQEEKA
jgi:hypothetical protein